MKKIFTFVLTAAFLITLVIPMNAQAKTYKISYKDKKVATVSGPKKISKSKLTGRQGHDTLTIAKSQNGYTGKKMKIGNKMRKLSYYGNVWANMELIGKNIDGNETGNWCSEFASWCARQAGVSRSVYPAMDETDTYRSYFSKKGRFFKFSESGCNGKWFKGRKVAGTMKPSDLQEGDILQIGTGSRPHHTAIFKSYKKGRVYTYDGNKGNAVLSGGQMSYPASEVMAVIRPQFNDNLQISAAKEGNGIRIILKGLRPFTNRKRNYSVSVSGTDINDRSAKSSSKSLLIKDDGSFKKGKTYKITVCAKYSNNNKTDNTFEPVTVKVKY